SAEEPARYIPSEYDLPTAEQPAPRAPARAERREPVAATAPAASIRAREPEPRVEPRRRPEPVPVAAGVRASIDDDREAPPPARPHSPRAPRAESGARRMEQPERPTRADAPSMNRPTSDAGHPTRPPAEPPQRTSGRKP